MQSKIFTQLLFVILVLGILPATAQTPFFEEHFSDEATALADWTSGGFNEGSVTWTWSSNPSYGGYGVSFAAPTASDGFMVYDSDANGFNLHAVTLTSPAIDCSDASNVYLELYSQYVYYLWNVFSGDEEIGTISRVELGVSTDGENFTYQDILTDIEPIERFTGGERLVINIPDAIGQETVYLQFRWNGYYEYWWAIDDIALYETEPVLTNDLAIFNHGLPSSYFIPLSQVDSLRFIGMAENKGADPQTNVRMRVSVLDPNDALIYQDSSESTDMLAATALDTFEIEQGFLPETIGNYFVFQTVRADENDDFGADNRKIFNFQVTEDLFGVDNNLVQNATQPSEFNSDYWEAGSYYYTPHGTGYEAYKAQFMIFSPENAHIGETVNIQLYKWNNNDDFQISDNELELIGFTTYTFSDDDTFFQLIDAPLYQDDGETIGYPLQDSSEYILTISLPKPTETLNYSMPYVYHRVLYDYGAIVRNGDDWFSGGFGPEIAFVLRMGVREITTIATKEPQLDDSRINAFPNPTKDWYRIDLDLENASPVQLQLMSIAGQTVIQREYTTMQRDRIDLDVSDLPAGAYLVKIRTEEGVKTLKMNKQ
ncbi:MAG: T9SS type A sorting domain-containing protein [Saprospiraceae bacterium]|nr:T9SS type A sorting domain-containing protein [Lewinella sp.]